MAHNPMATGNACSLHTGMISPDTDISMQSSSKALETNIAYVQNGEVSRSSLLARSSLFRLSATYVHQTWSVKARAIGYQYSFARPSNALVIQPHKQGIDPHLSREPGPSERSCSLHAFGKALPAIRKPSSCLIQGPAFAGERSPWT